MSENKVITQEELQEIKMIKSTTDYHVYTLGQLAYEKLQLDLKEAELKDQIKHAKQVENNFLKKMTASYGDVSENLETGEITSLV